MSHLHEQNHWSSGSSNERSDELRSLFTVSKKFDQPLFAKLDKVIEKDSDSESNSSDNTDDTSDDSQGHSPEGYITVGQLRNRSRALMEKLLTKSGYPKELIENEDFAQAFAKALVEGGEIVSKKTGRSWIERSIPEEPPAFVRPDRLKVGNKVQMLNWIPMGVHGATIDLFPRGLVTKMYVAKCLVTKEPLLPGCMPGEGAEFEEQERLLGLELDGKGPYPLKDGDGVPAPFITKDSSIIMRFPEMAQPSGRTEHVEPGIF